MRRAPLWIALLAIALAGCAARSARPEAVHSTLAFRPVTGFSPQANEKLRAFLARSRDRAGRKVAVFDGDGTVLGQAPHYLADECLYQFARAHPERRPELIAKMRGQSNVSIPYVQNRVHFLSGMTLQALRDLGRACYLRDYAGKVFAPMRDLIALLQAHGFEVWIVTASPEAMYQLFLSAELGIPITHVVGVKSVVRGGIVTDEIVMPVPQDRGKKEAIETFVQERPLLVAGNSRGDKEMIEYSQDLRVIVNPDEHVAPDQKQSIADYAREQGWLVVRIRDVPAPGFPAVSSRHFGIRLNKSRGAE
ncbi:MAG: haloacid dehalogenase-like hydrolase [Deltaproteobacteria bacterium]|nr:haloacid dehalogenase-like hydrolase [Deltaproteobacteria bacterium]